MKKLQKLIANYGRQIIGLTVAAAVLLGLLWFRLGSLTQGRAADMEIVTNASTGSWISMLQHPLFLPYTFVLQLVHYTGHNGITSLRLVSTMFGILAAVLFYIVARQWHNSRAALLGTWLFISSAWFLHISRLGTPEILWLVSTLAIVVLLTPRRTGQQTKLDLPLTLLGLVLALYVPGMIWLVLAGLIVRRKSLVNAWQATRSVWLRFLGFGIATVAAIPLAYGLVTNPDQVNPWLGFGGGIPRLLDVGHNLLNVPLSLALYSSFDPVHWLGRLPVLSVFELVVLAVGMYFYAKNFRAARTKLIAVLAVIGWALVGVMGMNAISLVLPVVYLLAASGIAYLLHLWLRVFPNNPIARTVGIAVIALAILLTSFYQTRSYFVAWRYNPETSHVFHAKID